LLAEYLRIFSTLPTLMIRDVAAHRRVVVSLLGLDGDV